MSSVHRLLWEESSTGLVQTSKLVDNPAQNAGSIAGGTAFHHVCVAFDAIVSEVIGSTINEKDPFKDCGAPSEHSCGLPIREHS